MSSDPQRSWEYVVPRQGKPPHNPPGIVIIPGCII